MEKVDDAVKDEEKDTNVAQVLRTNKRWWVLNRIPWKAVEISFFTVVIIVIWILFALPLVFYLSHAPAKKAPSMAFNETVCTPQLYAHNNSVCFSHLERYKMCDQALRVQNGVYISSSIDLQESESIAFRIKSLQSFLSPNCRKVVMPFACLYLFPLCGDNHKIYFPSSKECISISTKSCADEWENAKMLINSLPDCKSLPDVSLCREPVTNPTKSPNLTSANCSKNFVFIGMRCLPACPGWILRGTQSNAQDIVLIFALILGLICGVFVILISFLRNKRMLTFPSILVVYQLFATVIIALLGLIGFANAKALYCTAPDWTTSMNSTTAFCNVSGAALFFCLMQIAFLWVCHVCVIFWSVAFPISFLKFTIQRRMKMIHAIVVCLMIVVPMIPVAVAFGTGGFTNARFPPLLCSSKNADAAFYGLFFPMSILLASGVSLMIGVFWTIRKKSYKNKSMGSANKKIFIVFCYYVLLGVIALASFVLNTKTSKDFISSLSTYFACESEMPRKCESYREEALRFTYPGMSDASYFIVALYPLVNLVYTFDFGEVKQVCCFLLRPLRHPKADASQIS